MIFRCDRCWRILNQDQVSEVDGEYRHGAQLECGPVKFRPGNRERETRVVSNVRTKGRV